jgi:thiamine kinase-like enzyme
VSDPDAGTFTLVLQDLARFARPGDQLTLHSVDEIDAILEQLVGLQVPTWNNPALHSLPWLADAQVTITMFDQAAAGTDAFIARHEPNLAEEHVRFFRTALPTAGAWIRSWGAPTVFQHGDLRPDNLMFGTTADDAAITIIDFQTGRLGPPGIDLAYCIASTLSDEDRRAHLHGLVEHYHARLQHAGIRDFDLDACWESVRSGSLYGVFLWVGMSAGIESTERGDQLIAAQIARFANMAIELNAVPAS